MQLVSRMICPALISAGLLVSNASAQQGGVIYPGFQFTEVGASAGLLPYQNTDGMGSGLAAADFDNDGDIDVFVPTGHGDPDRLYRNNGNGTFTDIAAAMGVNSTIESRIGLWLDCDGDGDLDLLVANDIATASANFTFYEYTTSPTPFQATTSSVGFDVLHGGMHLGGMAAGDINNDGYLDVYIGVWDSPTGVHRSLLMQNNGDGTFADVTLSSGVYDAAITAQFQPMFCDFNNDGWQDIYVAVDFVRNLLLMNNQDGTFTDVAVSAGAANLMNDMGLTLSDMDNDGDFDIHTTNVYKYPAETKYNLLLENVSTGPTMLFSNVSLARGVASGGWGWGTTFADVNADGLVDLAATNGWAPVVWPDDNTRLWLNTGAGKPFVDVAPATKMDDKFWGSGLVSFDYDRDGDLDFMQVAHTNLYGGGLRLLRNSGTSNHSLTVRPRMNGPNTRAIGAIIKATTGATTQMRLISAGTSFMGQEPAEAFFGLGTQGSADQVRVTFPDSSVVVLDDIAANQVITVTPPPLTYSDLRYGTPVGGDNFDMLTSDNIRYQMRSELGPTPAGAPARVHAQVVIDFDTPAVLPSTVDLSIEASASFHAVVAMAKLYNWSTKRFELVGYFPVSISDAVTSITGIPAASYVDPLGRVKAMIHMVRISPSGANFVGRLDAVTVTAQ